MPMRIGPQGYKEKECHSCKKTFKPKTPRQIFCSTKCGKKANGSSYIPMGKQSAKAKAKRLAQKELLTPTPRPWQNCTFDPLFDAMMFRSPTTYRDLFNARDSICQQQSSS